LLPTLSKIIRRDWQKYSALIELCSKNSASQLATLRDKNLLFSIPLLLFLPENPKMLSKINYISAYFHQFTLYARASCELKVTLISLTKDHLQNIVLRTEKNCYFAENLSSGALVQRGTSADVQLFCIRGIREK
jgi:hypothetical protein